MKFSKIDKAINAWNNSPIVFGKKIDRSKWNKKKEVQR